MICPNCSTGVKIKWFEETIPVEVEERFIDKGYVIQRGFCPECNQLIIFLRYGHCKQVNYDEFWVDTVTNEYLISPQFSNRKTLSDTIPEKYVQLFQESEQVNNISPRASATLSRYLLQMLLHEELHIHKRNLEDEIKELEGSSNIPTKLVTMLQVMRRVANFGAHPKKSTNSNEIVEVEAGESAVMLDLLEEVFDYIFVKPKQQELFLKGIEEKHGIKP